MSQCQLDRDVARQTGESLRTIRRRGFSIIDPSVAEFDSEPKDLPAQFFGWVRPRAGILDSTHSMEAFC